MPNTLDTLLETAIRKSEQADAAFRQDPRVAKAEEKAAAVNPRLGQFVALIRANGIWMAAWAGAMALLLFLNIFIGPDHPHFDDVDRIPGFWAVFGLGFGVGMIFVMKRIVQPLIKRNEDYYGDI